MKHKIYTLFLGGMILGLGLYLAPMAHAEEPEALPDKDQLGTEITTQAHSDVNTSLTSEANTESSTASTTSGDSSTPAASDTLIINTGEGADVDTSSQTNTDTTVQNNNDAAVGQKVNATANTGNNSASRNISFGGDAGIIHTGDATVYSELETAANSNQTGVNSTCPAPAGSNSHIVNTGDDLNYDAGNSSNCNVTVTNGNGAAINQVVNANANTGGNIADRNISFGGDAGVITTGDAKVGTLMVAKANHNVVLVGGVSSNGGPGSGASIHFVNTGDNAMIDGRSRYNSDIDVTNSNTARLNQLATVEANTGNNDSSRNINPNGDAGVIQTGDAVVVTELSATANSNHTVVGQGQAGSGYATDIEIVNTGDELDVDAGNESTTSVDVDNTNTADIDQEVNVEANTGNNTADRNIAFGGNAGVITTGDAIIATTIEADVNTNATLVTGSHSSNATNESETEIINTGDDVDVDVSNNTETDIDVDNTNTAEVDQEVNVEANTGNNTASGNIGNTSMTTGNVTVTTEIITNANNNYTFIVDSGTTGLDVFKQFVEAFLGMSWDDLVNGGSQNQHGNNVSLVNTGDNVNVLAENTTTKKVAVSNNNTAKVNQSVNVHANTGGNTCTNNVGGCNIVTGDATIWTKLIANLNNNFTFIGKVQLPEKPEQPVQPEQPEQPEKPVKPEQPQETDRQPEVHGEDIERQRPTAVLAATTLPMTGGSNLALVGGLLLIAGAGLIARQRKVTA